MSKTDSLIDRLATDGAAPRTGSIARFVAPMAGAATICAAIVILAFDSPFASVTTDGFSPIFVKWGFSIALLLLSGFALWFMGRPGRSTGGTLATLTVPFVLVAALLVLDLLIGQQSFPGETWRRCLIAMALMSPIAFAGAIIATRSLAPVRPSRAGFAAGLFGGAVAMTAYSPYCPERGMVYMAVFYCLPILAMAAIGWLLGPRLLRW